MKPASGKGLRAWMPTIHVVEGPTDATRYVVATDGARLAVVETHELAELGTHFVSELRAFLSGRDALPSPCDDDVLPAVWDKIAFPRRRAAPAWRIRTDVRHLRKRIKLIRATGCELLSLRMIPDGILAEGSSENCSGAVDIDARLEVARDPELVVGVKARFLADTLVGLRVNDVVTLSATDDRSPIRLEVVGRTDVHVVMPHKLANQETARSEAS